MTVMCYIGDISYTISYVNYRDKVYWIRKAIDIFRNADNSIQQKESFVK